MAKIFLDTNILVDILSDRSSLDLQSFTKHDLSISCLSIHIVVYILKIKVPSNEIDDLIDSFNSIELYTNLCKTSSQGPTKDLEYNIQLHSCVQNDCDYFLTNDKELLKMIYFGKTKIINELPQ